MSPRYSTVTSRSRLGLLICPMGPQHGTQLQSERPKHPVNVLHHISVTQPSICSPKCCVISDSRAPTPGSVQPPWEGQAGAAAQLSQHSLSTGGTHGPVLPCGKHQLCPGTPDPAQLHGTHWI